MASTVATLHETAQALLDATVAAVSTTVGGPPPLTYLSPGQPALDHDCDIVAVWTQGVAEEATSPLFPTPVTGQRRRLAWINLATLQAQVARCVHSGPTPSGTQLTSDATLVMEDAWAIWNGVASAIIDGSLFDGVCQDVHFIGMQPFGPMGGKAGWIFTVAVALDGYTVEVP